MSNAQMYITIAVLAFSVMVTRFMPFIVFKDAGNTPAWIDYLGKVLPAALMGLLVVYCFKDYAGTDLSEMLPSVIAAAAVAIIHILKRNTILSISVGTALYMILIRVL